MNHNNPDYYRWHPAAPECYRVAQEFSYNCGNALTYIWRAGRKPGNDAVKDLQKAIDHLRFEIERLQQTQAKARPFSAAVDGLREASIAAWNAAEVRPAEEIPAPDSGCGLGGRFLPPPCAACGRQVCVC